MRETAENRALRIANERERDRRNLNPTAPAVIAMSLWGSRYAAQSGGSMDFWDKLTDSERRTCEDIVTRMREADKHHGVK